MALELPPALHAVPIPWKSCPSFTVSSAGLTFSQHLQTGGLKPFYSQPVLLSLFLPSFQAANSQQVFSSVIPNYRPGPSSAPSLGFPQLILAVKRADFAMGWQFIPTSYHQQITLVHFRSHAEAINLNNTENYSPNQFLPSRLVHPSPVQSVAS